MQANDDKQLRQPTNSLFFGCGLTASSKPSTEPSTTWLHFFPDTLSLSLYSKKSPNSYNLSFNSIDKPGSYSIPLIWWKYVIIYHYQSATFIIIIIIIIRKDKFILP